MQQPYFSNMKCYTKKHRCAVFGCEIKDNKLEIFILRASLNDSFDKELSRDIYEQYLVDGVITNKKGEKLIIYQQYINEKPKVYHPEILVIPVEGKAQHTFKEFCDNNFYKRATQFVRYEVDVLFSKNEKILISKPRRWK